MFNCKICDKNFKNMRSLSSHLSLKHSLKVLNYFLDYENFQIPKCVVCGKNAKYKSGLFFRDTCGDIDCIKEERKKRKHTEESKNKMRKSRLKFMKNNPEKTAWRTSNQLSWPERYFIDAVKRNGLLNKFEVVREKSFFPYYVDFAFINVRTAVEIQGSQHYTDKNKIESDEKKKNLILSKGWSIYYINANQVMNSQDECIKELLEFIGDVENPVKTSKMKTSKEIRDEKLKEKERNRNEKKKLRDKFIKRRKKDLEEININKWGGVSEIALRWNVSHTQVRRWIKKNIPELNI